MSRTKIDFNEMAYEEGDTIEFHKIYIIIMETIMGLMSDIKY